VLMVTLYDRLGGNPLRWSGLKDRFFRGPHASCTPQQHRAATFIASILSLGHLPSPLTLASSSLESCTFTSCRPVVTLVSQHISSFLAQA